MRRVIALMLPLLAVSMSAIGAEPGATLSRTFASSPMTGQEADLADRTQRDPRVRDYVTPKRIVWQSSDEKSSIEHVENC